MEKLPEEIVLEIFYRLPPESVGQCKCVCKSWCNLLLSSSENNNFANINLLQHRRNQQRNSRLSFIRLSKLIIRSDMDDRDHHEVKGRSRGGEFHITEYDEVYSNYMVKTIKLPDHIGISWNSQDQKLASSCNGLLCLPRTYDQSSSTSNLMLVKDRICICNPLLKEYVFLPQSDIQLMYGPYGSMGTTYEEMVDTSNENMVVGFGHHSPTDEYKVVRVYYPHLKSNIGNVEVYTLGKNSMWRSIGTVNYRLLSFSRPVLINGSLHWLAQERSHYADHRHQSKHIVSFNLETEKFHMIPDVPQIRNVCYDGVSELKELGGCLCLMHRGPKLLDIWAWKKKQDYMNNKEKYSWVQEFGKIQWRKGEYSFSYSACAIIKKKKKKKRINNGSSDHQLVLMWRFKKELVCYDSNTQTIENVVCRRRRRRILDDQRWGIQQPSDRDPILHINSVISLKALGEDAKLYPSENHLKRKDMGIKTPGPNGYECHRCALSSKKRNRKS